MSEAEFERLIGLYSGTVYRTAYCRTGNAADAEDIMQEAFCGFTPRSLPLKTTSI